MRKGQFRMRGRGGLIFFVVLLSVAVLVTYYIWNRTWASHASGRLSKSRQRYINGKYVTILKQQGQRQQQQQQWQRPQQQHHAAPNRQKNPLAPPRDFNSKDTQLSPPRRPVVLPPNRRLDPDDEDDYLAEEDMAGASKRRQGGKKKNGPGKVKKGKMNSLYMEPDKMFSRRFRDMQRIVHLDLKGAAPRVSYLEKIFPILKKAGATGLLVEYEDMFPYTGYLDFLAADTAYSMNDVVKLLKLAKQNSLDVIPLVPTFGHMEFVLKHYQFVDLRETASTPQVISPAKNETYTLIGNIISQVLGAHPDARYIHIGHDEVYELGKGQSDVMKTKMNMTSHQLFIYHLKKVVDLVRSKFPRVKILMWDDTFRSMPENTLKSLGLAEWVQPMVWNYETNVKARIPSSIWKKYGKVFPNVWIASSYKGSTGVSQYITNTSSHLQNHYSWIQTIQEHQGDVHVVGMALTGWSRYDYFSTLTELLPEALPSLVACLTAARNAGFTSDEHATASDILSCTKRVPLKLPPVVSGSAVISQDCAFPGSGIFYAVQNLWGIVNGYENDRSLQGRIRGWLTDYHIYHGFSSPGQLKVLNRKLSKVMDALTGLRAPIKKNLEQNFDQNTVEEWLDQNVDQRVSSLRAYLNKSKTLGARSVWGKRPLVATNTKSAKGGNSRGTGGMGSNNSPRGSAAGAGPQGPRGGQRSQNRPPNGRQFAVPGSPNQNPADAQQGALSLVREQDLYPGMRQGKKPIKAGVPGSGNPGAGLEQWKGRGSHGGAGGVRKPPGRNDQAYGPMGAKYGGRKKAEREGMMKDKLLKFGSAQKQKPKSREAPKIVEALDGLKRGRVDRK